LRRLITPVLLEALASLDEEIGLSKNLRKVVPIKLIAVGGYVSVTYFRNREATEDVDYILDPTIENQAKVDEKLQRAIERVAKSKKLTPDWINDKVAQFAVGTTRLPLFQESIAQDIVLFKGKNLIIYAAKWEWSLARKLKRIGSTNRVIDIDDAVAILHEINQRNKTPMNRQVAKEFNTLVYSPIEDHVLDKVAESYKMKYGEDGLE
jgi:hypothetical protein